MPPENEATSVASALLLGLRQRIAQAGGWLPFDAFMAHALYAPGLGYYAHSGRKFGLMPQSGSDFVTAPELSPHFGRALAVQLRQAMEATGTCEVFEFGAGSGALAEQLLASLGSACERYTIVELSAELRERQRQRLGDERVRWLDAWPDALRGVVVGNEVLDAMPVKLLHFDGTHWLERGVVWADGALAYGDRATALSPPVAMPAGATVEIHPQAEAFVRSLGERLAAGAAFFIDYGFPQAEYYHPQRDGGTLMCHRAHQADTEPLVDVGLKDITAHVNFSAVAQAAQEVGLTVLGYASQGRFLLNLGLAQALESASVAERAMAARLVNEHEMGELFKVLGLAKGPWFDATGFAHGDRTHRL